MRQKSCKQVQLHFERKQSFFKNNSLSTIHITKLTHGVIYSVRNINIFLTIHKKNIFVKNFINFHSTRCNTLSSLQCNIIYTCVCVFV